MAEHTTAEAPDAGPTLLEFSAAARETVGTMLLQVVLPGTGTWTLTPKARLLGLSDDALYTPVGYRAESDGVWRTGAITAAGLYVVEGGAREVALEVTRTAGTGTATVHARPHSG